MVKMRRGESWGLNNTNEKHAIISAALSADDTHVQTLHTTDKRNHARKKVILLL